MGGITGPMSLLTIVLAAVAFFAGLLKSGFGIGAGIFLTPILALVMDAKEAVVVVAPMMLFTDMTAVYQYWRRWDMRDVVTLALPCLIGAVAGAFMLKGFAPATAGKAIGVIGLLYVGSELGRKFLFRSTGSVGLAKGALIGIVGGAASALANSGGVFISTYFAGRLPKAYFVGTLVLVLLFLNVTKVGMFTGFGMLDGRLWTIEFYLLPLMFLGGLAGKWINNRIDEAQFAKWIFALIVGACLKLLFF